MRTFYSNFRDALVWASFGWFLYIMGGLVVDLAKSFRKHPSTR